MKTFHLLEKLNKYPLFTENDIAKILNKGPKYIRTLLYRLSKQGIIKRIEKGKYTTHNDVMIFASYIITPSYLSLWTALRYYNMIQQQPYGIFVISPVPKKSIKFQNTEIIFRTTKHIFGYTKERYSDFDIFIAVPEKAIIDSLLFKLPIEDIKNILENEELELEKLSDYAKRTKNLSLIKRLGYLLEKIKSNSYGLKPMDNNYILLDYSERLSFRRSVTGGKTNLEKMRKHFDKKKGKKDNKWKLIVNTEI